MIYLFAVCDLLCFLLLPFFVFPFVFGLFPCISFFGLVLLCWPKKKHKKKYRKIKPEQKRKGYHGIPSDKGVTKFSKLYFFQSCKLELEDADTDTERYKSPSLNPHGPAGASVILLTRWLMCKPHLKRLSGHHSFKVTVCQPRMSAKCVLPRILPQEAKLCTTTPMHPREVIDVFRGSNQATAPRKKTWTGNTETHSWVVSRKCSKFARQKLSKIFAWPLRNRRKLHIFGNFAKFTRQTFQDCSIFEIFAAKKMKKNPNCSFSYFCACFLSSMAHPQSANSFVVLRSCRAIPLVAKFRGEQISQTFWVARQWTWTNDVHLVSLGVVCT